MKLMKRNARKKRRERQRERPRRMPRSQKIRRMTKKRIRKKRRRKKKNRKTRLQMKPKRKPPRPKKTSYKQQKNTAEQPKESILSCRDIIKFYQLYQNWHECSRTTGLIMLISYLCIINKPIVYSQKAHMHSQEMRAHDN